MEQALGPTKELLSQILNNYEAIDEGAVLIDGKQAAYLVGRFGTDDKTVQNLQYFIPSSDGKQIFAVTFSATPVTFEKHEPLFNETANTIKID